MVRNSICLYPLGYPVTIDPARADHWTMPALEAARESWGGGEARFEASPLQIQIRARPGPAPVKSPPRFRSRPGWIQLICDASNRAAFVPSTRSARLVVSSGLLLDRDWFRRHLLEPLVLAALDRVYFTPLHAACVTGGGRSILLCGDSGAGKSTLTYACARRGWTFVADDAVHLTPFPENIVAAGSSVIRLREPARALFPELQNEPSGVAPNGKIAIEIVPRNRGFAVSRFANPSHLVFLSRRPGKAQLRSYPVYRALAYFLKYLWHYDTSAHQSRLQQLLDRGVYLLEYETVDSGVDALEALVAKPCNPLSEPVGVLFALLADPSRAHALSEAGWRGLLESADRTHLTLHLRNAAELPAWVRKEIEARFARNAERRIRLREAFGEIARALSETGIEFAVLKGVTHESGFGLEPSARVQYDIDLVSPNARQIRQVLRDLGYHPHGAESLSDEHERPMVRPSQWSWCGDYFDPQMPIPVEVHSTPWSPLKDRIKLPGVERFWSRRQIMDVAGVAVPAYSEPDRLAFAAMHVLRHALRNDARPAHAYELATFLGNRRFDTAFWVGWQSIHSDEVKTMAAVAFRFAQAWFGCALPEAVEQNALLLPDSVTEWFREFAWSPVVNLIEPNKDVLWLHLALVKGMKDRLAVVRSRLAPLRIPARGEAPNLDSGSTASRFLWKRAHYHAAGSSLALVRGARWWLRRTKASTISHT